MRDLNYGEIEMKLLNLLLILAVCLFFSTAHSAETISEKAQATKDDIKRDAKKAVNRVEESTCTGTDAECAKQKIGNRAEEAKDAIKDKSSEIKNNLD